MPQFAPSPKRCFAALASTLVVAGLVVVPGTTVVGAAVLPTDAAVEAGPAVDPTAAVDPAAEAAEAYGELPMSFAANEGQAPAEVKFMAAGRGYSLALTATEAVLTLSPAAPDAADQDAAGGAGSVVRMRLEGANPHSTIEGLERLPGVANYLTGKDPDGWHTDVATYAKVAHRDVYPGIDLVWYGHEGQLEHDFVVGPGADPDAIEVVFDGAERLTVHSDRLDITLPGGGTLTEHIPAIYQTIDGQHRGVAGHFESLGHNRVGFAVGAYDADEALVIDPVLDYSTYLGSPGGFGEDDGQGIAVDAAGNAYVTGFTDSLDFPTTDGAFNTTSNGGLLDVFVAKLNFAGTALVYSTYLGGSGFDTVAGIAVQGGEAYVVGGTDSADFPTTVGAFDSTFDGHGDTFVTKLDTSGSALVYSTYLGGSGDEDQGLGIAVDGAGNTYVTGATDSADFPTTAGAFDTTLEGAAADVFVTKVDPSGSTLVYSSFLGGGLSDIPAGIAVQDDEAYVTGGTESADFPTTVGAFDTTLDGASDVFAAKLDPAGSTLAYSTYLGGSDDDRGTGIATDRSGGTYVTGFTFSVDFPTTAGVFDVAPGGGSDAFVTKIEPTGTALEYSTYLGGFDFDEGSGIAVDAAGSAYVTGVTDSADFPTTPGAFDTTLGGSDDAFVAKLDPTGTAIVYSTYLGGAASDGGRGIAIDADGAAYVIGDTDSDGFPTTPGAFDAAPGPGFGDVFVTKLSPPGAALEYSTYLGGTTGVDEGNAIAVDGTGSAYVTGTTFAQVFPTTPGTFDEAPGPGGGDVFVTKLNATGTALEYSTYLGGTDFDSGAGIAVDAAGRAYLTGFTASADFPTTPGAFDETPAPGGGDVFVTKLSPSGTVLAYSTYLGGTGEDQGRGIALDGAGSAYVTGVTDSADFPTTPGALDQTLGGPSDPFAATDAFATKFDAAGTALEYSTYLGGADFDQAFGIAVDGAGRAYVTGQTGSTDFPTTLDGFDVVPDPDGSGDAFVTKLNASGTDLEYSTYLGGTGFEQGSGIAVDGAGRAYVTGGTSSADFPTTPDAFQTASPGGFGDAFVTKLDPLGAALEYSTYLGGTTDFEDGRGVAVDAAGAVYVTGRTFSADFPTTPDAIDGTIGGRLDGFVTTLNPTGTAPVYSTYLGGSGFDESRGIAVDGAGSAYVTGTTFSTDFPTTPGAFQTANLGTFSAGDAFVTKIATLAAPPTPTGRLTVSVVGDDPDFSLDGPFDADFTLEPGESTTFEDIPAGVYTLTMTGLEDGLVVDAISCGAATLSVDLAARRVVFEVGDGDAVTCRFTVFQADDGDGDGGYDDDPGGPGFGFDSPFDDAGQTDQPGPAPTGDPTLAGVLAVTHTETSGGGPQGAAVPGDLAGQPAVGPVAGGELPRTGKDLLPMGVAVGLVIAGQALRLVSRRRKARTF